MVLRAARPALSALFLVVAAALLLGPIDARGAEAWVWPVDGEVLTEYRNGGDPYASGQHRGLDIAAAEGAPAVAAVGGTVRYRGVAGSSGLTVSIRTADGHFDTAYLHLSAAFVEKGQVVTAGQRIGAVGTTGRRSAEAAHLHFGVREAGSRHDYLDPRGFLGPPPATRPTEPRGAPAPVSVPVPVAPAPAPVGVPVGAPVPVRVPVARRVRVPGARRVRAPAGRRVRTPAPSRSAPGRAGVAVALPARVGLPALEPLSEVNKGRLRSASPRPGPAGIPALGPGAQPQGARVSSSKGQRANPVARAGSEPAAGSRPGPDVGWAIACVGLLLAAACVGGRPGGSQDEVRARRAAMRSLLKPLLGGR